MKHWLYSLALICLCVSAHAEGGNVSGTKTGMSRPGTSNTLPKYLPNGQIGNSSITDDGVAIATSLRVSLSSATFVGVSISSSARGSAGTAVTATCPADSYAISGGCDCTIEVAETSKLSVPSPTTPAHVPNGWTCQSSGGTGGQCAAYVICSRLQ